MYLPPVNAIWRLGDFCIYCSVASLTCWAARARINRAYFRKVVFTDLDCLFSLAGQQRRRGSSAYVKTIAGLGQDHQRLRRLIPSRASSSLLRIFTSFPNWGALGNLRVRFNWRSRQRWGLSHRSRCSPTAPPPGAGRPDVIDAAMSPPSWPIHHSLNPQALRLTLEGSWERCSFNSLVIGNLD